jgi:tRNA(fMet)-specific endonuclease VapC
MSLEPVYMLDTDIASFAMRGYGNVSVRLVERKPAEICISALTLAELRHGADLRSHKLHKLIDSFLTGVAVAPFDASAAARYGKVSSVLVKQGTPIGSFDALIAAHALALDVTLVTNNTKHFGRVAGLRLDNWV